METRGKHGSSQLLLNKQQNPGDGPLAGLKKETNLVPKMDLKTWFLNPFKNHHHIDMDVAVSSSAEQL